MYTSTQSTESHTAGMALHQFANDWRAVLRDLRLEEDLSEGVCQTSTPSFYDYHAIEPIGNWLINLHRYWTAIVDVSSGKSSLGPREYTRYLPKIGGAYLLALENMLTQAADHTNTVTTTEVWWELYRWQNECDSAADPNLIPYLLRPELWPKMGIRVTLAITGESTPIFDSSRRFPDNSTFYKRSEPIVTESRNLDYCEDGCGEGAENLTSTEYEQSAYEKMSTLWDAASAVEGEKGINSIIAGEFRNLQIDTECDSDTEIEARVSPEAGACAQVNTSPPANHPLLSGDFVEDEEMFSRVMQSPHSERATFTSMVCDNG